MAPRDPLAPPVPSAPSASVGVSSVFSFDAAARSAWDADRRYELARGANHTARRIAAGFIALVLLSLSFFGSARTPQPRRVAVEVR